MAQLVPTRAPASVVAGDTLAWRITLSDYPASAGWVLKYRLINAAGHIDITAGADGDDHLVGVPATSSAAYAPGEYTWRAAVEKGDERYTVGTGEILIKPDIAAQAGGFDLRSSAKKTLALLDAALEAHGAKAWTQEYEINSNGSSRRMKFRTPVEFEGFYNMVRREVVREEAAARLAAGLPGRSKVCVRF